MKKDELKELDQKENLKYKEKQSLENNLQEKRKTHKKLIMGAAVLGIAAYAIFKSIVYGPDMDKDKATMDNRDKVNIQDTVKGNDTGNVQIIEDENGKTRVIYKGKDSQDLKDEKKNTINKDNVDKGKINSETENPTNAEIVDNSKEEETTKSAVEDAKNKNINVVQGDVKDKDGKSTGDKITATEGKTSNTVIDGASIGTGSVSAGQATQDDKKDKKKIDVSGAKDSQKVNNNTKSQKESELSDEQLRKIAGESEKEVKTQPSQSEPTR